MDTTTKYDRIHHSSHKLIDPTPIKTEPEFAAPPPADSYNSTFMVAWVLRQNPLNSTVSRQEVYEAIAKVFPRQHQNRVAIDQALRKAAEDGALTREKASHRPGAAGDFYLILSYPVARYVKELNRRKSEPKFDFMHKAATPAGLAHKIAALSEKANELVGELTELAEVAGNVRPSLVSFSKKELSRELNKRIAGEDDDDSTK